ncbi:MAG: winged helix-turn-helix transcriptional regulator [Leptolyngbya sp. SIO1E4]|nr:winged helix-turn-helix transcriptional regulator [Leptolyngbya sp. SIO1E4]
MTITPQGVVSSEVVKDDCEDDCMLAKLSPAALQLVAEFFKVLSESSRLQIVCSLRSGPRNVSQIIEATGLGQANVSKHLKILAQAGVVTREQQGVCVFYQIMNPFVFDLCELVCNSLAIQIQQQAEQQEALNAFRKTLT